MKKELDDLLCQRYPNIFVDRHKTIDETTMAWGFTCADGWFDLIDTLCELLQFWADHNNAPQVVAVQVKEKFGRLCFYARAANDEQKGMIAMATALSERICDQCGKPGQTMVHEFLHQTRCEEHAMPGSVTQAAFVAHRKVLGIAP